MKSSCLFTVIPTTFFIFLFNYTIAQIDTSTRYLRFPRDHKTRIITDQKRHIRYVLDTSHILIEAVAENGNRIWRTDPWLDYKWTVTPTERPIILSFILENDSSTHFKDVLAVRYDNLGFAGIDATTGKIISIGED